MAESSGGKTTKNKAGLSLNTGHDFDDFTLSQLIELLEPQFFHLSNGHKKPTSLLLKFELKDVIDDISKKQVGQLLLLFSCCSDR